MRRDLRMTAWSVTAGFALTLPLLGLTSTSKAEEKTHLLPLQPIEVAQTFVEDQKGQHFDLAQVKKPRKAKRSLPIYRPPRVGSPSPGQRVGGGTRGTGMQLPVVTALVPDHTGQTIKSGPTLYWFVSEAVSSVPVFFTFIEEDGIDPLVETRIASPREPGIQRIRLVDHEVRLEVGRTYQWSITLAPDLEHRSKDVVALGAITRVEPSAAATGTITRVIPPETVVAQLPGMPKTNAVQVYAEAGLWYDAIMAISELIEADPTNAELRQQRAALLEQVTLPGVAAHDASATAGTHG